MKFKLLDYSTDHYDKLPSERGGKFIQVFSEDCQYIIMAPKEMCTFHANIAEIFFTSINISGKFNHKRDEYKVNHPAWTIAGGGHWAIDDTSRTLDLQGQSMAYGSFVNDKLSDEIERVLPEFKVVIKS